MIKFSSVQTDSYFLHENSMYYKYGKVSAIKTDTEEYAFFKASTKVYSFIGSDVGKWDEKIIQVAAYLAFLSKFSTSQDVKLIKQLFRAVPEKIISLLHFAFKTKINALNSNNKFQQIIEEFRGIREDNKPQEVVPQNR